MVNSPRQRLPWWLALIPLVFLILSGGIAWCEIATGESRTRGGGIIKRSDWMAFYPAVVLHCTIAAVSLFAFLILAAMATPLAESRLIPWVFRVLHANVRIIAMIGFAVGMMMAVFLLIGLVGAVLR